MWTEGRRIGLYKIYRYRPPQGSVRAHSGADPRLGWRSRKDQMIERTDTHTHICKKSLARGHTFVACGILIYNSGCFQVPRLPSAYTIYFCTISSAWHPKLSDAHQSRNSASLNKPSTSYSWPRKNSNFLPQFGNQTPKRRGRLIQKSSHRPLTIYPFIAG